MQGELGGDMEKENIMSWQEHHSHRRQKTTSWGCHDSKVIYWSGRGWHTEWNVWVQQISPGDKRGSSAVKAGKDSEEKAKSLAEEPVSRNVKKRKVNPRKLHRCELKKVFSPLEHWWLTTSLLHILLQDLKPLCWVAGANRRGPALACCPYVSIHWSYGGSPPTKQLSCCQLPKPVCHPCSLRMAVASRPRQGASWPDAHHHHHFVSAQAHLPCRISAASILIQCSTAKVNCQTEGPELWSETFFWSPTRDSNCFSFLSQTTALSCSRLAAGSLWREIKARKYDFLNKHLFGEKYFWFFGREMAETWSPMYSMPAESNFYLKGSCSCL